MDADHSPVRIHEAVGPDLPLSEGVAAIALGVFSLLMAGVLPILLGALVELHRLSAPQLGLAAMSEGITMGLGTGLAAAFLPPRRLRLIAVAATLGLVGINLSGIWLSGLGVIGGRGLAGLCEGLLLWLSIGMIARSQTPERLSAILLLAVTAGQFVLALSLDVIEPRFGATGGLIALSVATLPALGFVPFLPRRYADLVKPVGESAAPPLRGWAAVIAITVFTASFPSVAVYLQPMAHQAGLGPDTARLALSVSLFLQIAGGIVAAFAAGRVHYLPVLTVGTLIYIGCWVAMTVSGTPWLFVGANAISGFSYMIIVPFLIPMAIEADPSRRAAMMSGGAQVLAGALGPLSSSFIVSDADVHPAVWLASGLILSGLVMIGGLFLVERRQSAHRQLAIAERTAAFAAPRADGG